MEYISWQISLIAFLPALILCGYIYYKDRIEKEPIWLLALLFAAGAVAYIPALLMQKLVCNGLDRIFVGFQSFSPDGSVSYTSSSMAALHSVLSVFIGVALVETVLKWCVLFFITHKNKHFNYLFDGIVYSVFVSLGFAAVENVRYAWVNGWDTIVLRSVSSIPCHLLVGIIMGYFYTMWRARQNAGDLEEKLYGEGKLDKIKLKRKWQRLLLSAVIPFGVTGIYLLAGSVNSRAFNAVFYFVVFTLYGFSFIGVDRIASRDSASVKFSLKLLKEKHPNAAATVWEGVTSADQVIVSDNADAEPDNEDVADDKSDDDNAE